LIEVALPLEALNDASAHEKSVPRKGHPATLHLWWARRPLAAARAVLFAQLVDDPSARPDEFPTEDAQRKERDRLHELISDLVKWENVDNTALLERARHEILRSLGGRLPTILDPFAGGGTIPLEAQRLGLVAHASDLNPVAVLINKALIEIPPKFRDDAPIFPGLAESQIRQWTGAEGLGADVRAYGRWMRDEAERRIGAVYPAADDQTVIAWIWARTVTCPNPACGLELPLVRSWWLGKKKGRETYIAPKVISDPGLASGLRVDFEIRVGKGGPSIPGTMAGKLGATCLACQTGIATDRIKEEGLSGRMGQTLVAVVAEGNRQRVYLAPSRLHREAALVRRPESVPDQELAYDPRNLWTPQYGLTRFSDLFTDRQLLALCTFSDLVDEAKQRVIADGGDPQYAAAVATYLAFAVSKLADWGSSICGWIPVIEGVTHTFSKQAIPMTWDFTEINPLSNSVGNFLSHVEWVARSVDIAPCAATGVALQVDARQAHFGGGVISTDPPYYANIDYANLADFFYVWLRRSLRSTYPDLLGTLLTPKVAELVANPYRHGGPDGAKESFEEGFRGVFARARQEVSDEFPMTVYYAYREAASRAKGGASTGWETLLEGMVRGGWAITSTWPIRSEREARSIGQGTNALASSIVLSLRPRPADAPTTDRRGLIEAMEGELPDALRKLQQGQVAPVDLPQAAIGPGMAVYSRYAAVLESDGTVMTVRSALERINDVLDQVLHEQEGDFDPPSRFAIAWYRQHGYGIGKFGDADNLARARNTSVDVMDRDGILISRAGNVQLTRPADLSWGYDVFHDSHTSNWEALHHLIKALERDGIGPAGDFLQAALARPDGAVDADLVKELAHLLFRIAEGNGWTKDALSFNNLVTSWPEIWDVARSQPTPMEKQFALDFDGDE
jgi:putative DNA methylase